MAIDYARVDDQLGSLLKVQGYLRKIWEHAILASAAGHFARLLSTGLFGQTDTEEKNVYETMTNHYAKTLAADLQAAWQAHRSKIQGDDSFFGLLQADLPSSSEKDAGGAIEYEYEDLNGQISIVARRGMWGALRKDMLAGGYYVTANVIGFGSFTADNGNRGTLAATSMTGLSHALRGKATGTLVFTVEDESVSAPKLRVTVESLPSPLIESGAKIIEADNLLQPEKSWEDGPTAFTITLTRSGLAAPTEAGDGGAIFSVTSIATPKDGDMNGGVLYVRVVRQAAAPIWLIEFYNSSARTVKVGSTTLDGTVGTAAIDYTLQNGTRFQTTFDKAAANTALPSAGNEDADITFDIKTPRIGDRWTRTVTNDQAGNYSTGIAELAPVSLPTSGSSLFTDSLAAVPSI